jgi:hypothetical protein
MPGLAKTLCVYDKAAGTPIRLNAIPGDTKAEATLQSNIAKRTRENVAATPLRRMPFRSRSRCELQFPDSGNNFPPTVQNLLHGAIRLLPACSRSCRSQLSSEKTLWPPENSVQRHPRGGPDRTFFLHAETPRELSSSPRRCLPARRELWMARPWPVLSASV